MTTFGWDASHYDAPPTQRDGIDFYTHKLTDGNRWYEDAEFKQALENARDLGIPILGAYHVLWGNASIEAQAQWYIERLDALTPWWRTLPPGQFILQADAEPFSYNKAPTITQINRWLDLVTAARGIPKEGQSYSPVWYYSTSVTALRYDLWQSNYGANPRLHYRQAYPGDSSPRWNAPKNPLLLQYGSNATIGNQTTCDANAFRGDLKQLIAALGGGGGSEDEVGDKFIATYKTPDRQRLRLCDGFEYREIPMDVDVERELEKKYGARIVLGSVEELDGVSGPLYVPTKDRVPSTAPAGDGLTADEVSEIVRDEINNTRLAVDPPTD